MNFCPVLAISGTSMKPYSVDTMMQQIKRIYAEKASVRASTTSIYNDRLFTLDKEAEEAAGGAEGADRRDQGHRQRQ